MKKTIKKEKIVQETLIEELTCDICKSKAPKPNSFYPWAKEPYTVEEVTIEYKSGHCYPGDSYGEVFRPDICTSCWFTKIVPFLESLGVVLREEGWDH